MSNPTELPDLDRLEALARAATPGEWLMHETYACNGELGGYRIVAEDGYELIGEDTGPGAKDADFIAAANPAAVLTLIALARRAQPEGEAPQADHEGWNDIVTMTRGQYVADRNECFRLGEEHGRDSAAQHAESGAQEPCYATFDAWLNANPVYKHCHVSAWEAWKAALAAQSQGAQPDAWAVVVGENMANTVHLTVDAEEAQGEYEASVAGGFESIYNLVPLYRRAQQAAAPGPLPDRWSWSKRGMELDPNGYYVAYGAPGTPEAPKGGA